MMRPRRLERRLDAAVGQVVAKVEEVGAKVNDRRHHDAILAANVARVDGRIEAVHLQHAAAMAAVNAELSDARRESVRSGIADLAARLRVAEDGRQAQSDRADALAGEVEYLRTELERMTEAWLARGEQIVAAEQRESAADRRADALEVTVGSLTVALVAAHDLLRRAVPKVAAKTTRARYTAELAALTAPPDDEPELADSA